MLYMLGWILLGLIVGAAIIISVTYLDRNSASQELRKRNIWKSVVRDINKSGDVTHIKLDSIDEEGKEQQVEFEVESYNSSEIKKGTTIYT